MEEDDDDNDGRMKLLIIKTRVMREEDELDEGCEKEKEEEREAA